MKIEKPSIFFDMTSADYFADPCPAPSLTQSLAKILLEKSPLHAWHAHPRLNPDYQHDDDTKYDIGNIAHKLMIGRGKELIVLDQFDDWRTKAAKEAREQASAQGKLAVLGKKFMVAQAMVRAAMQIVPAGAFDPECGNGEVVIAWEEDGLWFRSMIDWLILSDSIVYDLKTTGMSAAPHGIGRMMADAGWDIQAAMQERGLIALGKDRHAFRFVAQENTQPYALTVSELSESVLTMGRKKLAVAMKLWRQCFEEDRWPGYPTEIIVPDYPGYAEASWLDREQTEFAKPAENLLMAG